MPGAGEGNREPLPHITIKTMALFCLKLFTYIVKSKAVI